jgi:hypothetical protein
MRHEPHLEISRVRAAERAYGDLDSTYALNYHSNTPNFISKIHFSLPYMVYVLP